MNQSNILPRLQASIAQHGHDSIVQDGELFGLMRYSKTPSPLGCWERIEPSFSAVLEWLGY